jgi:phosphatidate cytidylyltransferase
MIELFKLLEHCWDKQNYYGKDDSSWHKRVLVNLSKSIYIVNGVLVGIIILAISEYKGEGFFDIPFYMFIFIIGLLSWAIAYIPVVSKKKSFKLKLRQLGHLCQSSLFPILIILPLTCSFLYLFAYNKHYLFFVLLIIWLADTGAYITGKRFGKTKIAKNISPGKTLEGVIGAMVINVIFMQVIGLIFSEFNIIGGILFGFIVTLLSIYGDLFISWIKRSAGVKDTGNIIPGHGGFLDRVDSFLLALPFAALINIFAPSNLLTI